MKYSKKSSRVHNLGTQGFGPGEFLRDLRVKKPRYFEGLSKAKRVLFFLPLFHMERVVGPTYIYQDKMYWLFEKPWFELTDEGEFIEMGKFSDRPWSWFFELFNQTYFFKSFGISFPSQYGPRHYNFLAKMMKAVEIESNKQAPQSKFTVVLYPNWSKKRRDLIVKSFKEQGVDYLDLSQVPIAQFTDHMAGIPLDSHPTACENNILAQILVKELELK